MPKKKKGASRKKVARLHNAGATSISNSSKKTMFHDRGGLQQLRKWDAESAYMDPSQPGMSAILAIGQPNCIFSHPVV